ncbi:unnamed protein product, partial [marine sediment metagenome]
IFTKYASLASISSLTAVVIFMMLLKQPYEYVIFSIIILILTIFRHKENIKRLRLGKEKKFGEKIKIRKEKQMLK